MKQINEILGKNKNPELGTNKKNEDQGPPKHEIAATVNLIKEAGLVTMKYGYTYWLGKTKRAKVSYVEMHGILKDIANMSSKYNRGGALTNRLTKIAKNRK